MSYLGANVEYGIHCILQLVDREHLSPSAKDLAEFQGVSTSYVAKIFTKLKNAGLVKAAEGINGGYRLARHAREITVLDVVEAVDGKKTLFRCKEIRRNCALYQDRVPDWVGSEMCAIHAVMQSAEQKLRKELAKTTIADLSRKVVSKAPKTYGDEVENWFEQRLKDRAGRT